MYGGNFSGGYLGNFSYGMNPPSYQGFNNYQQPYSQNQGFNSYQQSYSQNSGQMTGPKINVGFVASGDEAKALQTPMDGSILYLINSSKGEIYSKSLAPNGAVDFHTYSELKEASPEENAIEKLQKRVESLEKYIAEQKQPAPSQVTGSKKGKVTNDEQQ